MWKVYEDYDLHQDSPDKRTAWSLGLLAHSRKKEKP
jgi:hypothetical protein